jgi:hypothetical protein
LADAFVCCIRQSWLPDRRAARGLRRWAAPYEDTVEDAMDVALLERLALDRAAVEDAADLGHPISFAFSFRAGRG